MRCKITASLRATAALARLGPTFFNSFMPHAFNVDQLLTVVSNTLAAS